MSTPITDQPPTWVTSFTGRKYRSEEMARTQTDVAPKGISVPRPWEEYRAAVRYAELM
jgi:hypothetical protein